MAHVTRDALIIANAVFFAGMGALALATPTRLSALVGLGAELSPDARNEVRAVYGGFGVAVAAVLGVSLRDETLTKGVACAVGAALAGMAAGRLVAALIDRTLGKMPPVFFIVESSLAAMLFAAAVRT